MLFRGGKKTFQDLRKYMYFKCITILRMSLCANYITAFKVLYAPEVGVLRQLLSTIKITVGGQIKALVLLAI